MKNKKVVVIAPHPDDEVIGCGGSIAKHIKNDNKVFIIYLTTNSVNPEEREYEAKKAGKILGITEQYFMRKRERFLSYAEDTLKTLIKILRKLSPNILYSPHPNEWDIDHKETYKIVNEAIWLSESSYLQDCEKGKCNIEVVLLYEVWTPILQPNYFEDISKYIDIKTKALKQYSSQIHITNFDKSIRGLNEYRGIMSGVGKYAEAFKIKYLKKLFY